MVSFRKYLWLMMLVLVPFRIMSQPASGGEVILRGVLPDPSATEKRPIGKKISDLILGTEDVHLEKPVGIWAGDSSDIWILDQAQGSLFHIVKGVLKKAEHGKDWEPFPSLVGITPFQEGTFLITDSQMGGVFLYDPSARRYMPFGKTGILDNPTGIVWLPEKNVVWVTETRKHRIAVLNMQGDTVRFIGERGIDPGFFNYPTALQITPRGNIRVVDALNYRIQELSPEGVPLGSFGKAGDATGYFARPKGIAVDSCGNIYVSDALYHAVQIFSRNGELLYYFGGQGREQGKFWMPSGLYIDPRNYLYVADTYNARIQYYKIVIKP